MSTETLTKVLLVEDERSIREALRLALGRESFHVLVAGLGADAMRIIKEQAPDIIVLDVGLPDTTGFELCKQLRSFSDIPVIFLTARGEEIDRVLGLELGADDYMTKPFSPRELVARLRSILKRTRAGAGALPPPPSSAALRVDEAHACIRYNGQALPFTRAEYTIVATLIAANGRVLSRSQMLAGGWDAPDMTSERTIDVHIRSIRAKLRAAGADAAGIETHRGFGYSFKTQLP